MTDEEIRQLQHLVHQQQEHQLQQLRQHIAAEEQKLLDKVPEWKGDRERAKREIADIKQHLIDHHGYSEQDLVVIPDHRNLLAARELMRGHQREQEAKRRAADERTKRERREKAEADKAAQKKQWLEDAKRTVRKTISSHDQAEALANAIGDE